MVDRPRAGQPCALGELECRDGMKAVVTRAKGEILRRRLQALPCAAPKACMLARAAYDLICSRPARAAVVDMREQERGCWLQEENAPPPRAKSTDVFIKCKSLR